MSLDIADRSFRVISIVDDDKFARKSMGYPVEELGLASRQEEGILPPTVRETIDRLSQSSQAAICDHHIRVGNYSTFLGADLVAQCYAQAFPAILCTRWEQARIDEIRHLRRYIPALLKPSELDPESIRGSLQLLCEEFDGRFRPHRKPWRALVRIEEIDGAPPNQFVFFVVPTWGMNIVRFPAQHLPRHILAVAAPGRRLHAMVNMAAESDSDLYFDKWEAQ